MEYSRNGWDIFLWPRTWHKRLNAAWLTLIPGVAFVGLFDMLISSKSILNDFILNAKSGVSIKVLLFLLISAVVGFLDVFCFAWPIADLCRYIAKRSEKFIVPGFNVILMKSYAYSHLLFLPVILLTNPTGLHIENLSRETPFITQLLIEVLVVFASTQSFWQLGILLRTISVKSKLELSGKMITGAAIFLWFSIEGEAVRTLIHLAYQLFGTIQT